MNKLKSFVLKCAELICAPVTDLVLTMNEYDFEWAKAHKAAKAVDFIPGMGADDEKSKAAEKYRDDFEDDAFVLIYPAEFSARKNQRIIIEAMAKLPERVKLVLPGKGDLLEECKALAASLGVSSRVIFPGHVNNVASRLKGADAAVTSSRSEGLPFNVLEAMQCALPVIASRAKGNTDLVSDGVNGFLFDDAESLAASVNQLLVSPELKRAMGERGRELSEQYSLKKVYPVVMDAYMKIPTL